MNFILVLILIILLLILAMASMVAVIYNRLVTLKNRFKNAFSQIDVQLRRRYDLIPNIVNAAKAYLKHESQTLEAVTEARAKATGAQVSLNGDPTQLSALNQLVAADGQLTSALGRLLVSMEAYPELKADQTISEVREELATTENRIAFARQAYNDAVMYYNEAREKFPAVLFSEMFGFGLAEFWVIDEARAAVPPTAEF
ncbi:MAG: LemA family protein [Candidatus Adiutrix sp.]|jgi:LemA protein|nr:LemA family protein [Candidatus Adiutrix sp.]